MEREAPPLPRLGKYELLGELGRGGMGVVYRVYDHVLEREVALKTMVAPQADRNQTERFLREAKTAGGLHHPNIVTIHELGQESGTYYIAMELLEGRNLRSVLSSGQLPPIERRLEIVARVCDGLDYAHRAGIVHRDIKPANIFLMNSGAVKILDFGIAKIVAADNQTKTGLVLGTIDYMSPEQVRAKKNLDGRSDVFSAGVILYELLFRRTPFSAEDLGAALHRILHDQPPGYALFDQVLTPELADALRRSLDKRCEARFARAGEMAEQLDRAAGRFRGRAGTELQERIEEVVAAGVLERSDLTTAPELPEIATATSDADLLGTGTVTVMGPGPTPARRTWPWVGLGALVVVVAVGLAAWLASVDGPPANVVTAPDPAPLAQETVSSDPPEDLSADSGGEVEPVVEEPAPNARMVAAEAVDETPSPPVAAPRTGALSLSVMPWATVEWIENLDTGERTPSGVTTPTRIELVEGRYRLRVASPYVAHPVDLDTTVHGNRNTQLHHALEGFDPVALAAEILAAEEE